jgi:hypothetical protein
MRAIRIAKLLIAAAAAATLGVGAAAAQTTTTRPAYGCFKVTVPELNVRDTAFSSGKVVATAIKGETLVKRRRFCTARGFWCAVTTNKGVQGYADKSMMTVAACPARLSTKTN